MPLEKVDGGWRVRLRYGVGLRDRFFIVAKNGPAAQAKAARMKRMAADLAACGKSVEAKAVLEEAGLQQTEKGLLQVEEVVRVLCAESPAGSAAPKGPVTFRDVGEMWMSGELRRLYPDDVKSKGSYSLRNSRGLLAVIYPLIGDRPVASITLDDAERVKASLPPGISQAQRAHYARHIRIIMSFAEYPLRLIERSPIPPKFVPGYGLKQALGFLYPDEDAKLLGCAKIEKHTRLLYGFLTRNGLRISEALALIWEDIDLQRGVLTLDKNKTSNPRAWLMSPDVVQALSDYRGSADPEDVVFPEVAMTGIAKRFREHLLLAGVDRRELHARTKERRPLRVHDLRATFITLALANGATETWVMDRTGHTTSAMLAKYRRQARHAAELNLGWLVDLDTALVPTERVGQGVGQDVKFPWGIGPASTSSRSGPGSPEITTEPKTAESVTASDAAEAAGPAGLLGVGQESAVETALAYALKAAIDAGQWQVAQTIVQELGERRRTREQPDVPSLDAARKRKREEGK
jgi:integrase